ncbi:cytochrome P450 76T24 [Coffea arabica]|uniref:Cytochrome P450 76T24 n=1 Tax=Coffea arabica TaxID=13443 RepID=A0A6P6V8F4_COFAR|nr:ferruginol synthase-like [Coffea arabica]
MEKPSLSLLLQVVLLLFILYRIFGRYCGHKSSKLPPGPYQYPIVGNMFQLSGIMHSTLAKLSKTYGPLMSIKVLNRTMIIVSSPKVAKELLQKYDHLYTSRLVLDSARAFDHHKFSVVWLPINSKWRNHRKLCKEQLFSSERLNASQGLRQEKVQQLCNYVHGCCINGEVVDIGEATFTTMVNIVSSTFFSVDFGCYESNSSQELKENILGVLDTLAKLNLSDFFPVLRAIDPQGIRRQTKFYFGKLLQMFDEIIRQRLQEREKSLAYCRRNDLLEVLLDLIQQHKTEWSIKDAKHLFLDLFQAAFDTISSTMEWAMAELLRNPDKMEKAKTEIREIIGHRKLIQDSDISALPYLRAIVKEALRLYPPASTMSRYYEADVEIDQYIVPKNTLVLVNLWAIGRDSSVWSNPDSFVPERFLDSEIDVKGHHFELLPFSTGRRICVGMPLAERMIHLILASLIHNFDWKLEEGMKPEDIGMREKLGITMQKAAPLKAIPIRATM